MKLITCPSCGAEAIGPATEKYPRGMPYVVRKWTSKQYPLTTKCRRCFAPIRLTAVQFNGLPDMPEEQQAKYDMHRHREMEPPKRPDPKPVPKEEILGAVNPEDDSQG